MSYVQFLALLLSAAAKAKTVLPRLLANLEKLVAAFQDVVNDVNDVVRDGQPLVLPARTELRFSESELAAEAQILAAIRSPAAAAAPTGVSSADLDESLSPAAAPSDWDGARLRRLWEVAKKLLPLVKILLGVELPLPADLGLQRNTELAS